MRRAALLLAGAGGAISWFQDGEKEKQKKWRQEKEQRVQSKRKEEHNL